MSSMRAWPWVLALAAVGSAAPAAAAEKILKRTFYEFPNALPGRKIEVRKVFDPDTNRYRITSNAPQVRSAAALVALENEEARLARGRYGALVGRLRQRFAAGKSGDSFDVRVHLKQPAGVRHLDKTRVSETALIAHSRSLLGLAPTASIPTVLARHGLKSKGAASARVFRTEATRGALASLMFDENVAAIVEAFDEVPVQSGTYNFSTFARSAYNHSLTAVPSNAGEGARPATFETGLDPNCLYCFNSFGGGIVGGQLDTRTAPFLDWEHSQGTFRLLQRAAPGASLWHRWAQGGSRDPGYDGPDNEAFIVNNAIQTMSLSYSRGRFFPLPDNDPEFLFMDDFAYRYPFPLFCNPTDNMGYQHEANWQGYNGISVGNVRHTNARHFELPDPTNPNAGCTQTKNPPPRYGSTADREMPYLVAPGINPGSLLIDECDDQMGVPPPALGVHACGTSWSAPVVNGIAADVIAADARFPIFPEKVRAVLLLTAQNVHGGHFSQSVDGRDGAGVVHGAEAVAFARTHTSVLSNGAAVETGMDAGPLSAVDFDGTTIRYNIKIPNPKPEGKHLRVVLTWNSNPDLNAGVNALSDLDLRMTVGGTVHASTRDNSNIEILDVPRSAVVAGATYAAHIHKLVPRFPSGARADFFYYAIGWTWVKDHAP